MDAETAPCCQRAQALLVTPDAAARLGIYPENAATPGETLRAKTSTVAEARGDDLTLPHAWPLPSLRLPGLQHSDDGRIAACPGLRPAPAFPREGDGEGLRVKQSARGGGK